MKDKKSDGRVTKVFFVFICILGFFFVALTSLPASTVGLFLPKEKLSLELFHGTIWNGGAMRSSIRTSQGPFKLGHLEWTLSPVSWLAMSPKIRFQTNWGGQSFSGIWKIGFSKRMELIDSRGLIDVSVLNRLFPLSVDGILEWDLDNFFYSFEDKLIGGEGRLEWRGAKTFVDGRAFPLGSYSADLVQVSKEKTTIELLTVKGPVSITGILSIDQGGYSADLELDGLQEVDTDEVAFRFLQLVPIVDGVHKIKLVAAFP